MHLEEGMRRGKAGVSKSHSSHAVLVAMPVAAYKPGRQCLLDCCSDHTVHSISANQQVVVNLQH